MTEYPVPVDELEMDRQDMNHAKYKLLMLDRNQLAPTLAGVQRVLDIGTGKAA